MEGDRSLVGYEPQSEPLCPIEDEDTILRAIADARNRGTDHKVVRDRHGKISVWRRAHDFWE
jgi:hypothetical protein